MAFQSIVAFNVAADLSLFANDKKSIIVRLKVSRSHKIMIMKKNIHNPHQHALTEYSLVGLRPEGKV